MGLRDWKRILSVGLVFAFVGAPSLAFAQAVTDSTRAAARSLGVEGVNAYQAGDYKTASEKLERAYQLLKAPSLGLWSARALDKLDKLVEAGERYTEVIRLPISGGDAAIQTRAQADARGELDTLTPRIPSLLIRLNGADPTSATVTLDGEPVNNALIGEKQPIDPGQHHLVGTLGKQTVVRDIGVAAGQNAHAVLRFVAVAAGETAAPTAASPPPPVASPPATAAAPSEAPSQPGAHSSSTRTLGWVALGVGSAGIVFGGATGLLALSKRSTLKSAQDCVGNQCLAGESSGVSSYNSFRTMSSIGFVAGGVIGTVGVVLLLTSHPSESTAVGMVVGAGSAAVRGQF
jgi:hypothetical protein